MKRSFLHVMALAFGAGAMMDHSHMMQMGPMPTPEMFVYSSQKLAGTGACRKRKSNRLRISKLTKVSHRL